MEAIARFFRLALVSFKALFGWLDPKIYLLAKVVGPLAQLSFFVLLASWTRGGDATPWVVGNAFAVCAFNAVFMIGGTIDSERSFGTLLLAVMSPAGKFSLFVARGLFHVIDGALTVAIALAFGAAAFGIDLSGFDWPAFLASLAASILGAAGFGSFIGAFAMLSRDMGMVTNVALFATMTLSGASFPVGDLPPAVGWLSACLPLTRGIQAGRLAAIANGSQAWPLVAGELALGAVYLIAGYALFAACERAARVRATLDAY
jgi:ABC-2 type transport system permease protein